MSTSKLSGRSPSATALARLSQLLHDTYYSYLSGPFKCKATQLVVELLTKVCGLTIFRWMKLASAYLVFES